jgi:hypothetical protein
MSKKNNGAKTRLSIMQGRGADVCSLCGDEIGISACAGCGDQICKDCRMDHDCTTPDPKQEIKAR